MTVVADSTVLIYLAAIGRFDLLAALYGRILIPTAVYDEVVTQGAGRWGAAETAAADWIDQHAIVDISRVTNLQAILGRGESEVIVLAEALRAHVVIMDESAGRQELSKRKITFVGTIGILLQAKLRGLIPLIKPELDRLRSCGFHLSDQVYNACLALVGESP
jgi:predicted nucleic acid-binding protein